MRQSVPRILALVVAATAIVAAGLWLLSHGFLPFSRIPSADDNPTRAWQLYRNDEYGFTLRYPPEWSVVEPAGGSDLVVGFEQPGTSAQIQQGRVKADYRYHLSVRAYPTLAEHPLAKAHALAVTTPAEFFAQVPTVAARGELTLDGTPAYEFIANVGHQYYGLLVPHADGFLTLNFERTWTKARFAAAPTERAVLASFRWLKPPTTPR